MFKIKTVEKDNNRIIKMRDMMPCQIGKIITTSLYDSHIVMRTAASGCFEVMDLSAPYIDSCWTHIEDLELEVELLQPGEEITLVVI